MENNNADQWVDARLRMLTTDNEWKPDVTGALERCRQQRAGGQASRQRRTWAAAAILAVCVCPLAFPAPRAFAQRLLVPCVDACTSLLLKTVDVVRPRQTAPDFTLKDADGAGIRLSDYKGKVVLLNFWATWCPPCRVEVPWFVEFERSYRDQGFAVIGVSMDEDGWDSVKPFLDAKKINYRVAVGDDAVAQRYGGVSSLPQTLLIDREGRIAAVHAGLVGKGVYESEIQMLLQSVKK